MTYDKKRFRKYDDLKILHKVKKQWVTISLALLVTIGGGVTVVQTHASASQQRTNVAGRSVQNRNQETRSEAAVTGSLSDDVQTANLVSQSMTNLGNRVANVSTAITSVKNDVKSKYQNSFMDSLLVTPSHSASLADQSFSYNRQLVDSASGSVGSLSNQYASEVSSNVNTHPMSSLSAASFENAAGFALNTVNQQFSKAVMAEQSIESGWAEINQQTANYLNHVTRPLIRNDHFDQIIYLRDNHLNDDGVYKYVIHGAIGQPITFPYGNGNQTVKVDPKSGILVDGSTGQPLSNNFTDQITPRQMIRMTNVDPKLRLIYDNGNGSFSKVTNLHGVNGDHDNHDHTIVVPLQISGYRGEPYSIPASDIDGRSNEVNLYPNFNLQTPVPRLTVVLGEGTGNNSDENDNGNYWLDSDQGDAQRFLPMVGRRYFDHVYYVYKDRYYDGGVTCGMNGTSIDFETTQAKANFDPNLIVKGVPSYQFGDQDGSVSQPDRENVTIGTAGNGTFNAPRELYVQLVPKSGVSESLPVVLENYDNPSEITPAHVNVNHARYGADVQYLITRDSIGIDNQSQSNPLTKGNYLMSEGVLHNIEDVDTGGYRVNEWINIGDQPTRMVNSGTLKTAAQVGAYETQNGELVPILYYEPAAKQGPDNLLVVPDVYYNQRFWVPDKRDSSSLNDYNRAFVDKSINRSEEGQYNAYNIYTSSGTSNNVTWDLNGDYMPSGSILQQTPWNVEPNFRDEDPNQPDDVWYIRFDKDKDDQTQVKLLKAASGNGGNNLRSNFGKITYLGIANGSNGYNTEQIVSTRNGQTGFNVSYKCHNFVVDLL